MLRATEILGAQAYDAHGNFIGRVREMFIEPAEQANRVSRLLLGRGKFRPLVARHDQVASVAPGTIRLSVDELALEPYRPNEAWLAVRKDLLDQQIIDTRGRKVVRVNDLDMTEARTNGSVELRLTHVDVGLPGAVGRLLQGLAPHSLIRRIQQGLPPMLIPWEVVNLIEPDPLRRVKLRLSTSRLAKLHPADLADIVEAISPTERQAVIASLDEQSAAEVLSELDHRLKTQVVEKLSPEKAADILEEMPAGEAAHLLANLSPETSKELLEEMPREEAREMAELLQFQENTAGWMMSTEIIVVGEGATRDDVVNWIRSQEINPDQLDTVFLVNARAVLSGAVTVGRLLLASAAQPVVEVRLEPLVSVRPDAESKEVFELFDKYNLRSIAVVDDEGRPLGAITVDDVVSRLRGKQ